MKTRRTAWNSLRLLMLLFGVVAVAFIAPGVRRYVRSATARARVDRVSRASKVSKSAGRLRQGFSPRVPFLDASGFMALTSILPRWKPDSSPEEISNGVRGAAVRALAEIGRELDTAARTDQDRSRLMLMKALLLNSEGETQQSYETLQQLRTILAQKDALAQSALATAIYLQGVTALRWGENENCIMCRGESSCIFPISRSRRAHHPNRIPARDRAFHRVPRAIPDGSRGPLAAQPGSHDSGRVSRPSRSQVQAESRPILQLRVRHRQVP